MAPTETAVALTKGDHSSGETVDFSGKGLKLDKEEDGNGLSTLLVNYSYLYDNDVCSITAKLIVDAIRSCKKLTCLVLEGNTLGVDAAKAIGKALESQPHFERALWKDAFTGRLKDEIPTALVK